MSRKGRINSLTILEIAIIVLCAAMIIVMLGCYFMFSKDGATPEIFGKTVYVTNASNMEPNIPAGAAVFASDKELGTISVNDVVLFRLDDTAGGSVTGILRVQKIESDNNVIYYTLRGDASAAGESIRVAETSIIAKCVSYDKVMGAVIRFTTSAMGLLVVVIIPCLLLIVFQIVRIIRIRSEEDDDNYDDEDDEDEDDDYSDDDDEDEFIPPVKKPVLRKVTDEQNVYSRESVRKKPVDDDVFNFNKSPREEEPELVRKQAFVGSDGSARYRSSQAPTATTEEFRRAVRREQPLERANESEIPSFRARSSEVNNSYKPNSYRSGEFTSEIPARTERIRTEEKPRYVEEKPRYVEEKIKYVEESTEYIEDEEPREYYTPKPKEPLAPRAIEHPADITIPAAAKIPEETIAPPPKKNNNKTVEELMRMIDNAK